MYEIPKPELLDPDRIDRNDRDNFTAADHRSQAQLLSKELLRSCDYATQLWDQLNAVRGYLLDSLPPDPHLPGAPAGAAASPAGPDDESGWQNWMDAFASTTSVLCGAHGDSGFGLSRAREEAQKRRISPPAPPGEPSSNTSANISPATRLAASAAPAPAALAQPASLSRDAGDNAGDNAGHNAGDDAIQPRAGGWVWSPRNTAAAAIVAVLALRGLRPRGRRP